jgi:hypothetical protein
MLESGFGCGYDAIHARSLQEQGLKRSASEELIWFACFGPRDMLLVSLGLK